MRIGRNLLRRRYTAGALGGAAAGGGGGPAAFLRDTFTAPDGALSGNTPEVNPVGGAYISSGVDITDNALTTITGGTGFEYAVLEAASSPENCVKKSTSKTPSGRTAFFYAETAAAICPFEQYRQKQHFS